MEKLIAESYQDFLEDKKINEAQIISSGQWEMAAKKISQRMSIGTKIYGKEYSRKNKEIPLELTIVGFGDQSNAERAFQVEDQNKTLRVLKVTTMYGSSMKIGDERMRLMSDWDNKGNSFSLDKIELI